MRFLKGALNFSFGGKKAHWDKGGRRILLGNDTVDGEVMLRPIRFHRVEV